MSKKTMLLALTVVTATMFALPVVASAGEPEVHCPAGAVACGSFTTHGGTSLWSLSNGFTFTCTTSTGSGSYTSKKGGTFQLTFHGCKESIFGSSCTSPGQPAGTIKTNVLTLGNRYLTHGKTSPGIYLQGFNTTYVCAGIGSHHLVTGGALATITNPKCGGAGALTWTFEAMSHGEQRHKLITGTGSPVNLNNNGLGMALSAVMTATFPGKTPTVTCV